MFAIINQFGVAVTTTETQREAIAYASTLARKNNIEYYVCAPFVKISPPTKEVNITYLETQKQ